MNKPFRNLLCRGAEKSGDGTWVKASFVSQREEEKWTGRRTRSIFSRKGDISSGQVVSRGMDSTRS